MLTFIPAAASAQDVSDRKAWGYAFGAVGKFSDSGPATLHFGGGGEGVLGKGFGIGAEVGYVAPAENLHAGFGLFSVNPAYHFDSGKKLVPFITGGYSLAFRGATASGGNFGGGVQYWAKNRLGLRFEFRDHIFSSDSPHMYQFRVGITFR
ncbi:MAG TPA: hypothetical protein VNO70_21305 [Blastocatellia bacterium]|nr:hypothetical protein [Blastocatellia bacterium]